MDFLIIIFTILILATLILTYLLYKNIDNKKQHQTIFVLNLMLVFLLVFIAFSALPSNYTVKRIVAVSWLGLALIASMLKLINKNNSIIPEILLTFSTFGALVQTLIF